jgi:hypothetical protein
VNLLIQPGDGSKADGINGATKSIEMVIFRFDRREIEAALNAQPLGVSSFIRW